MSSAVERERDEWKAAAERATANAERLVTAIEAIPRDQLSIRARVALIAALEAPLPVAVLRPPTPEGGADV